MLVDMYSSRGGAFRNRPISPNPLDSTAREFRHSADVTKGAGPALAPWASPPIATLPNHHSLAQLRPPLLQVRAVGAGWPQPSTIM